MALGLHNNYYKNFQNDAMKLGLGLEKETITTYTSNTYPEARVLYPSAVAHIKSLSLFML
jgi:hypothetical protein